MLRKLWFERWRIIYLLRYRADKVAYLRSKGVRIGKECSIYTTINEFGTEPWLIEIGNRVTIAGGVRFLNHDGASRLFRDRLPNMNPFGNRFGTIRIYDNCFIGHSSILLPDIEIGPDSIVGAGSVVTESVPPGTVVAGNPARSLCSLDEYIQRYKDKMLTLEAGNRAELRRELTTKLWGGREIMPGVMYVIDSFAVGGAQSQLLELVRRLDKGRYQIAVCPVWPLTDLETQYEEAGVEIIRTHKRNRYDLSVAWRLAQKMRQFKPEIVHTWLFTGNLWGRLAALLARVPIVIAGERSIRPDGVDPLFMLPINRFLARWTDVIIANSKAGIEALSRQGFNETKLSLIYNGVDTLRFFGRKPEARVNGIRKQLGIPETTIAIGMVARLAYPKDQRTLLKAVKQIIDEGFDAHCVLVGNGPEYSRLEAMAQNFQFSNRVHFLRQCGDIPELLRGLSIFALVSNWEGTPNAVLEAMAAGLPVVATNVGGLKEVIQEGETGFLVSPGDPAAMADRLLCLINDPGLRDRMGRAGRVRCEKEFSLEQMVARTVALYEKLIARV